jgi:hypothetical protein
LLDQLVGEESEVRKVLPAGLLQRHQGNVREVFRELYEHFATFTATASESESALLKKD